MADEKPLSVRSLTFPAGRSATVVEATPTSTPRELVEGLGLPPAKAVIVVIGAADSLGADVAPRLALLFGRGVIVAARQTGAVIVDGGTDSGVMAVTGQAVGDREPRPPLVGVAPVGKVTYPGGPALDGDAAPLEPHHSHFVLAAANDWGGETDTLFAVASELAKGGVPAIAVIAGGRTVALREAHEVVQRGWPLVVLTGTGGVADEIAAAVTQRRAGNNQAIQDVQLADLVIDGDIELVPINSDPAALCETLRRRLGRDASLEAAWELFASFDQGATAQQREFRRMQGTILALGVLGTLLAVLEGTFAATDTLDGHWARDWLLRGAIIAVPIVLTVMVAAVARFRSGSKWVVLRGSAEAIRREIFRYRARAGVYGSTSTKRPEVRLADRVGTISSAVMKTDVNLGVLKPYTGPLPPERSVANGDDGFSILTPDRYIEVRLRDQARWYRGRTVKHERRLRRLRWAALAFGGLGTFLAAVGLELWIAVTTALVAAVTTYLEYTQVESTLLHYNQASADLETIRRWWISLPPEEQLEAANVNRLVEQGERIMQSESTGWMQDMQDAMAELRRQQEKVEADAAASRETAEQRSALPPPVTADGQRELGPPEHALPRPPPHELPPAELPPAPQSDATPHDATRAPAPAPHEGTPAPAPPDAVP